MDIREQPNLDALRRGVEAQRVRLGMTFDTLAVRTGLDRRTVIRLLRDDQARGGTVESWWRVCRALEVELADLISLLDEPLADSTEGADET
ncbi:helix-turn-helix transcriptional regulator [Curtobacterium pusillum]|uniref:helix-turn-helix domain-containing protein n=1 Tax=Curtobacterium pusillum TaxID=69373 RepID=UPI0011A5A8D4|nr:helix-turn-helix transcriptional regulator [Curtobacterium pusillum]